MSDSCNPIGCSLPGFSVCGILQTRILEQVAIYFPTQGLNPGLLHCRQALYQLSYEGSQTSTLDFSKLFSKVAARWPISNAHLFTVALCLDSPSGSLLLSGHRPRPLPQPPSHGVKCSPFIQPILLKYLLTASRHSGFSFSASNTHVSSCHRSFAHAGVYTWIWNILTGPIG